jgi:hypothetical protein
MGGHGYGEWQEGRKHDGKKRKGGRGREVDELSHLLYDLFKLGIVAFFIYEDEDDDDEIIFNNLQSPLSPFPFLRLHHLTKHILLHGVLSFHFVSRNE